SHDSLADLIRRPPVYLHGDLIGAHEALAVELRCIQEEVDEPTSIGAVVLERRVDDLHRTPLDAAGYQLQRPRCVPVGILLGCPLEGHQEKWSDESGMKISPESHAWGMAAWPRYRWSRGNTSHGFTSSGPMPAQ